MPQSLSLATVIEANRVDGTVPFICLIEIEVVDPSTGVVMIVLPYANNPEDVVFGGTTYIAGKFDLSITQESGKQASVTLTVNDYTQSLQGYMEAYGGGIGSNVTLTVVNAGLLNAPAEMVEYFQIMSASSADYTQAFTLGAENALIQTFPRRRQTRDFCQWRYKSTEPGECNYTGTLTTCDLTLNGVNGCSAHANTKNFGAMPGLNSNGYRYV